MSPARATLDLLLRREAGNEAVQPALRTMDRSIATALSTIDRFVEAQRILDGTIKLQIVSIALNEILRRAQSLAEPTLAGRGQRVEVAVVDSDVAVVGDAARLPQVVAQLIENAGVLAPDGAAIDVRVLSSGERIDVVVREPVPREQGFDAAEALESLRAPSHTHGLALAAARELMRLQRGALDARVDSDTGRAEWIVTMPSASLSDGEKASFESASPALDHAPVGARGNTAPQRILLVDDNQTVRNVYREALEELGYDVTLAANGEDALHAVEGSVPEVALIDVHLPTLNGYQLARALRARHPSSGIKLVLLSGMTLDDDMIRLSKSAGFDHCIDKSAGPKAIDALLRP